MASVTMNEMNTMENQKQETGGLNSFLQENDEMLHKVYYYMQAQWYGVWDPEIKESIDKPYEEWASDWYYELSIGGMSLEDMKQEVKNTVAEYVSNIVQEYELQKKKDEREQEEEIER